MLQETHARGKSLHNIEVDFRNGKMLTTAGPAAPTDGGSSGGMMIASRPRRLNVRSWLSYQEEGKGFVINIMRLKGFELAIGTVYLQSGVGPTNGVNPSILGELVTRLQALTCPWFVAGDWNCPPDELGDVRLCGFRPRQCHNSRNRHHDDGS